MSIEASVARIEAQNALIADTLVTMLATQKTHGELLKTLSEASPAGPDTSELDASIAATDAKLATLSQTAGAGDASQTAQAPATADEAGSAAQASSEPQAATESAPAPSAA